MFKSNFSSADISNSWKKLTELGPRFMGTHNEEETRRLIIKTLITTGAEIKEHDFSYLGWALDEQPKLTVKSPSFYSIPCESFLYCRPTPPGGIRGRIQYIGIHRVIDALDWKKFAVVNKKGNVLAYISGRPDGPAIPQPLDRASSPKPHLIIGEYDLALILSWLERESDVEVEATINCRLNPGASSRNIIASFDPQSNKRRIGLSAHYDSMYTTPGANDNAGSVASLLAIGTQIAKEGHNFPIDLFFSGGEEWDLAGSRAYVADRVADKTINNIKMLINLDGISEGSSLLISAGPEAFEEQLKKVIDRFEHQRQVKQTYHFPPVGAADNMPFYQAGVPSCWFFFGDVVKYHLPKDNYCPEGIDNIMYITELVWHVIRAFCDQDERWQTRDN